MALSSPPQPIVKLEVSFLDPYNTPTSFIPPTSRDIPVPATFYNSKREREEFLWELVLAITLRNIKYRIKLSPKTPWKRAENQVYLSSMHRSLSNGRQDPASKITLLASLSAQRLLSLQLENGQKME